MFSPTTLLKCAYFDRHHGVGIISKFDSHPQMPALETKVMATSVAMPDGISWLWILCQLLPSSEVSLLGGFDGYVSTLTLENR